MQLSHNSDDARAVQQLSTKHQVTIESNDLELEGKELDLVFVMDVTGSMGSYIDAAKRNIEKIALDIVQSSV
jgi:Mg-chelatase subunit ChlD